MKYPSIAAALDKSKLASTTTYIGLLEIDVLDRTTGAVLETVRLAHNNEPYSFQGFTYMAVPFEFDVKHAKNELPSISLTITDMTLSIHAKMEEGQGGTDFPVRLKIVSSVNPDSPEIEESFTITEARAHAESYTVEFTLGAENPLALRFPGRMMFRNRCFWKYRGTECAYSGPLGSCDFTANGPNGCQVHDNLANYGGFRGIRRMTR